MGEQGDYEVERMLADTIGCSIYEVEKNLEEKEPPRQVKTGIKGKRLRYAQTPKWMLRAREKKLRMWFQDNEVLELRRLPLYLLKRYGTLQGRMNEVKDIMKAYKLSRRDAIQKVYKASTRKGKKRKVYLDEGLEYNSEEE